LPTAPKCARNVTHTAQTVRNTAPNDAHQPGTKLERALGQPKWAFGIQWHPEDDDGHGNDLALPWGALLDAAATAG
jgi:hypothetical protein